MYGNPRQVNQCKCLFIVLFEELASLKLLWIWQSALLKELVQRGKQVFCGAIGSSGSLPWLLSCCSPLMLEVRPSACRVALVSKHAGLWLGIVDATIWAWPASETPLVSCG